MLDKLRVKLNNLPPAVTYGVVIIVLAGSAWATYRGLRPERPPPGSPYMDTVYRKCADPACGHVATDTRYDLLRKGYMPFDRAEEPLGEGRKCPKCGRMTLRFATRDAQGNLVVAPGSTRERE